MDIGTDKPSVEDRAKIPHHLIDVVNPDEIWTLADFQSSAVSAVEGITARGKTPFIVGGTGQYVRALTEGWSIPRQEPDPAIRYSLERLIEEDGPEKLYERLLVLDPRAAGEIDRRNHRRVIRALEVIYGTGVPFSEQRAKTGALVRYHMIGLTLPRQELYSRIDQRIDRMIQSGLPGEVERLLSQGYSADLPSFSAIGYREIAYTLRGETTLAEAVVIMRRRSRQLVRRQANWFKADDPDIHWLEAGERSVERARIIIEEFLSLD
jgi:tRNA dimethylallyltransferase